MPEFVNPFTGVKPDRKLTRQELIRAVRLSLSAEEEAVHLYEAIADASDNALAAAVLRDIANEERVHKGEFQRLIELLADDEQTLMRRGADEVEELRRNFDQKLNDSSESSIKTVGNLKKNIIGDKIV